MIHKIKALNESIYKLFLQKKLFNIFLEYNT